MEIVKSSSTIHSFQVGISIVEAVASTANPISASEIQSLTNLTKSNLYKYLNTLTHLQLLHRDPTTGQYSLGHNWIKYGMAAIEQEDVETRALPFLKEISQHCNCTVLFTVWTNNGPLISKIQSSNQSLNIGAQIGSILPPTSSTGKIFTSFLPPSLTSEWLSRSNPNPIPKKEMADIKTRKISFAKEPLVPSVSSMSIPVLNYSHELLGAITVVGFADHIPTSPEEEVSQYLIGKFVEISKNFGYNEN